MLKIFLLQNVTHPPSRWHRVARHIFFQRSSTASRVYKPIDKVTDGWFLIETFILYGLQGKWTKKQHMKKETTHNKEIHFLAWNVTISNLSFTDTKRRLHVHFKHVCRSHILEVHAAFIIIVDPGIVSKIV